jgi:hypothetical protein
VIIQTFRNKKGLIYGNDDKRIGCDRDGVLRIGTAEIPISAESESIMPVLFNGCTGTYKATFTDKNGEVYDLDKVTIRGGRIIPPPPTAVEIAELRHRADAMEEICEDLYAKFEYLSNIFDTNSLNFLIK